LGYPKRSTLGRVSCRPKEFDSDIFPRPNFKCNEDCPYYIFCKMEVSKTTLQDRIRKLRLSLQRPYHLFSAMENGDIYLVFENDKGERISFREKTIAGCVKKAEDYLEASKIRAGQQKKLEEKKEIEKEKTDEKIKVETNIRDDRGKKFSDSDSD